MGVLPLRSTARFAYGIALPTATRGAIAAGFDESLIVLALVLGKPENSLGGRAMKTTLLYLPTALLFFVFAYDARGQEECSRTLVMATINKTELSIENLSIAYKVSDKQWDEVHRNLGADGVIYGIPVGVSYGEFQNHVRDISKALNLTHFKEYWEAYS